MTGFASTVAKHLERSIVVCISSLVFTLTTLPAASVRFITTDDANKPLPCRIYLVDEAGKTYHPAEAPFWEGGFVSAGTAEVKVPTGTYHYQIEKGPEWQVVEGDLAVAGDEVSPERRHQLKRLADLKAEGWHAGDLHVHRAPDELPLHLAAEDLFVASVQTWWNESNPWKPLAPPDPLKATDGRYFHILGGEDERGGGALLFHRMRKPIDITGSSREWPASTAFLHRAAGQGAWIEIEKPFWWDTPAWLATGKIDSIGIAQNHLQREGMLDNEAWGRARDRERYPGPHGNGLYTQDLYYRILNCGLRIPPSAGSASGVLANPVGYNRVYVHLDEAFGWEAWWEGLREGRSFVTNGPLLRVTANGRWPGTVLKSQGPLKLRLEGRIDSRDPISQIELVGNEDVRRIALPADVTIDTSGWFLVRVLADVPETFRFASTAPWYVEVDEKPIVPRREAARFFLDWAKERREMVGKAIDETERRKDALLPHDQALRFWEGLLERSAE